MKLEKPQRILVVVESEKMPGDVFKLAESNVSVTNQPISEIAALAVLANGRETHQSRYDSGPTDSFRES